MSTTQPTRTLVIQILDLEDGDGNSMGTQLRVADGSVEVTHRARGRALLDIASEHLHRFLVGGKLG